MPDSGGGLVMKQQLLEAALFVLVFAAFYWSPVQQILDSKYTMLLSETILRRQRTFRLEIRAARCSFQRCRRAPTRPR